MIVGTDRVPSKREIANKAEREAVEKYEKIVCSSGGLW